MLRGRLHPPGAFVLGMASGAGFGAFLAEDPGDVPQQRFARTHRPARGGEPVHLGMVADILVARQAGLVADRDERLDVADLAIVLERMMREAQLARAPAVIPCHLVHAMRTGLLVRACEIGPDRHGEEGDEDHQHADPRGRALARHDAGKIEAAHRIAIAEFALFLRHCDQRAPVRL